MQGSLKLTYTPYKENIHGEKSLSLFPERQSRFQDFYDVGDGDWGWLETNIDEDGEQFVTLEIPETSDDFYFHVFSLSKENGIGVLENPSSYGTTRPLDLYCEASPLIRRYVFKQAVGMKGLRHHFLI